MSAETAAASARGLALQPRPAGWVGLTVWVVVTAVGTAVVSGSRLADYLYPGVHALTMMSLALQQWLILRRWIPKVGWWAPVTLVAWAVGPTVGFTIGALVSDLSGMALGAVSNVKELPSLVQTFVGYALVGVVVGGGQWLVLRRSLPRAGWWVLASALTWGFGELAAAGGAELVNGLKDTTGPELWYAGYWGANALLHALVSGAALAWITRGAPPEVATS